MTLCAPIGRRARAPRRCSRASARRCFLLCETMSQPYILPRRCSRATRVSARGARNVSAAAGARGRVIAAATTSPCGSMAADQEAGASLCTSAPSPSCCTRPTTALRWRCGRLPSHHMCDDGGLASEPLVYSSMQARFCRSPPDILLVQKGIHDAYFDAYTAVPSQAASPRVHPASRTQHAPKSYISHMPTSA